MIIATIVASVNHAWKTELLELLSCELKQELMRLSAQRGFSIDATLVEVKIVEAAENCELDFEIEIHVVYIGPAQRYSATRRDTRPLFRIAQTVLDKHDYDAKIKNLFVATHGEIPDVSRGLTAHGWLKLAAPALGKPAIQP